MHVFVASQQGLSSVCLMSNGGDSSQKTFKVFEERERECVYAKERERKCVFVCVRVCVWKRERERKFVFVCVRVCVWKRERKRKCVCVCESVCMEKREREGERIEEITDLILKQMP